MNWIGHLQNDSGLNTDQKASQKARGYGCSKCGNDIYSTFQNWKPGTFNSAYRPAGDAWKCDKCGLVFCVDRWNTWPGVSDMNNRDPTLTATANSHINPIKTRKVNYETNNKTA